VWPPRVYLFQTGITAEKFASIQMETAQLGFGFATSTEEERRLSLLKPPPTTLSRPESRSVGCSPSSSAHCTTMAGTSCRCSAKWLASMTAWAWPRCVPRPRRSRPGMPSTAGGTSHAAGACARCRGPRPISAASNRTDGGAVSTTAGTTTVAPTSTDRGSAAVSGHIRILRSQPDTGQNGQHANDLQCQNRRYDLAQW